jgi:hypothetical protein
MAASTINAVRNGKIRDTVQFNKKPGCRRSQWSVAPLFERLVEVLGSASQSHLVFYGGEFLHRLF